MQLYDLSSLMDTEDCRELLFRLSQQDLAELSKVLLPWPFSHSRNPRKFAVPRSREKKKRYHNAIKEFKRVLKIDPNFYMAWFNMGLVYGTLGKYNEAINCWQKTVKIDPEYADALYNIGFAFGSLGV